MKPKTKLWLVRIALLPLWLPFAIPYWIGCGIFWLVNSFPNYLFALFDYLITGKWENPKDDYDRTN